MSTDNYASEEETRALLRKDTRTPAERNLDRMLEERGASEQSAEPSLILRQIALELLAEQPAQPHQEPVAWGYPVPEGGIIDSITPEEHAHHEGEYTVPLYTSPPAQRTWVGLTDEEVMIAAYQAGFDIHENYENEDDPEAMHWWTPDGEACDDSLLKLRDLIEAKLKEKNT